MVENIAQLSNTYLLVDKFISVYFPPLVLLVLESTAVDFESIIFYLDYIPDSRNVPFTVV